ncbi:hypothetical protein BN1080_00352 [Planococcus massiliensis]|uniref:Uncharacterized protein n=1 Tax=Planococcus massiliensis TaxID=1499687 RepID=A0A098EHZ5_9BACL|nr:MULTISPECIES: hypothetical protein [Planococcus]MCJ1907697.1 hypothetical protein [Planococcus ruber]CEG21442.1 hypothetical protein BN1080_00352 [Planococcus massiliensis]
MHWMMWLFWGSLAAIFLVAFLVDKVTRGKYTPYKSENTLNQNSAEAEARRHAGRGDNQGPF